MLLIQLVLFCLLFFLMVKLAVKDDGLNCLYFYPKEYIEEACKRGLADKDETTKKGRQFMIPFLIILFVVLVAILAFWNHVTDFKTAYWQSVLFLVVMNWFDGIVIDEFWVSRSSIWKIKGMEGIPYTKPWSWMFKKRALGTVAYFLLSPIVAGVVVLLGKL